VLEEIEARGPRVIALSGHDSTPWTYDAFSRRFGDRYRTLRVGEELQITAVGG
jgi:7,8-dihydropterin-6-yl-methyl-4-(beta-D-ribofuranosyl)aminobenzene 5'-phosphate synthase